MNISLLSAINTQIRAVRRAVPSGAVGLAALYYFFPSFRYFAHDFLNFVIGTVRQVTGM